MNQIFFLLVNPLPSSPFELCSLSWENQPINIVDIYVPKHKPTDGRWLSHVEQITWSELPKRGNFQKLERDFTRQEGEEVDFQVQQAELLERDKTPAREE